MEMLGQIGKSMIRYATYLGGVSMLIGQFYRELFRRGFSYRTLIEQLYQIGLKSLPLTSLIAVFTGMVLALQFIVGLERFGLQLYVGQVVGISIVRELGPVLTALMVAARVGAGIAAELGSMTVTEQVDAIEAMGASPVSKLVVPRVLVTTFVTPLLTIIANVIGILGGMVVSMLEAGVSARFYIDQILRTVKFDDFASGITKTIFFGFLIGIIACYQGLNTARATEGVGNSTTLSVVISSVAVFVADFILTKLFLLF